MSKFTGKTNRPIPVETRRAIVDAYNRTQNASAVARRFGVARETVVRWVDRDSHNQGLQSKPHFPKTKPGKISDQLEEAIKDLRRARGPFASWGKYKIAELLEAIEGHPVVHPSTVRAVLIRNHLQVPTANQLTPVVSLREWDALRARIAEGIAADRRPRPHDTISILRDDIWQRLFKNHNELGRLRESATMGPLLIRSAMHLGHSLMNAGYWGQAESYLRLALDYLGEEERKTPHRMARDRTQAWETSDEAMTRHHFVIACRNELATVLARRSPRHALMQLKMAHAELRENGPGATRPEVWQMVEGNLERALGKIKLELKMNRTEVDRHLTQSQAQIERSGSIGMLAATYMQRARLLEVMARYATQDDDTSGRRAAVNGLESALAQAVTLVESDPTPMLKANFWISAAQLQRQNHLETVIDTYRLRRAAGYCLMYGYHVQARKLLSIEGVEELLPERLVEALYEVIDHQSTS